MAPSMPTCGDRTTLTFDTKQPHELHRYFTDLEFYFTCSEVTNDEEKKTHACRFLDVDTCELWQLLAKYTDTAKTYEDFKSVIYKLYPGAEEDRKWSIADMDKLIGEHSKIGILSINHFLDDPYDIQEVHNVARFVLHGTTSAVQPTDISSLPLIAPIASTTEVKTENLATMFEHITETFVKALSDQQAIAPPRPPLNPKTTGLWLKERIDEWHRRNPGQIARGQLLFNVLPNIYYDCSALNPADPLAPVITMTDTIVQCPEADSDEEPSDNTPEVLHPTAPKVSHPVLYIQVPPHLKPAPVEPTQHVDPLIHPYAAARDAIYVPPVDKVTNEVPQPPAIKKQEPAYHTMALIYDEGVTKDVYDRAMSSPITVTQHELLSLSLEVRAQIHEATAGRCIPQHDGEQAKILMQDDALPFALDDLDSPCDIDHTLPDIATASFAQILHQPLIPPEGLLIIPDS
ncbi:hypothetical protein EW146_g8707 [Bondarzewia mesenterica]|uniref:Uncharacterized protein n=1 Tax=Bondarzewia mesenterica TaxID=1095465 RepID=A0A4S4LCF7_9AGAM|nr:hypothetical protein EW146_g8707 [Bondarzewia mesenterica]